MPTCNTCGETIEFRYVGGRVTPIHLNGGWCSTVTSSAPPKPFRTVVSYVNPNALCPVCRERVYFYQSRYGGRVFFDDVGWPWPKHGCTDNPRSQKESVKTLAQNVRRDFVNNQGEHLDLYELYSLSEKGGIVYARFSRIDENRSFQTSFSVGLLHKNNITFDDFRAAPSFVVRTFDTYRILEFISVRKKKIDALQVPRAASGSL